MHPRCGDMERDPRDDPRLTAYWFGLTDGARWSRLTRIRLADGTPRSIAASALVLDARRAVKSR
jgi:hypothetical protein